MMDKYQNFAELAQNEREGEDYKFFYREQNSRFAIIAPHGGGIEPGTLDIADALAGTEFSFYAFKGMKKKGNSILHLTSNRFDEPIGLRISTHAFIAVSVHGTRDKEEKIFIGGKNLELKQRVLYALRTAGFKAVISEVPGLRGIDPKNICNRCKSGEGVQLEISRGLREKMFENINRRGLRRKTDVFYRLIRALKQVLKF